MSDKVFRDPLYNYVGFDRKRDGWLIELMATPEMQRLRRIHQLGVSNFTYPGADHTRFAHSLGVTHLMGLVLDHLMREREDEEVKAARQALLAVALLHDVGHGPFSHLFEPCLGINHEKWSIAVVLDESSQVHKILKSKGEYVPATVRDLIDGDSKKHPAWQRALISSQLDVDRLDYLRRDSLFTGSGYGHFDWHRLLTTVQFTEDGRDLVWPEKAALAIEEYIFARYYMYQNVYLHKTTRGFEALLQAMWRRADTLRADGTDVNANPVLEQFWSHEKPEPGSMHVTDYLAVEEFTVLEQIQRWRDHSDKALADCARRFLDRDGLAMVKPPPPNPLKPDDFGEWEPELHKLLKSRGYDTPSMYCLADRLKGKYRQPYKEEKDPDNQQSSLNAIRILVDGQPKPIGQHFDRLEAVMKPQRDQIMYYVPKEIRTEARELSERLAKSGSHELDSAETFGTLPQ